MLRFEGLGFEGLQWLFEGTMRLVAFCNVLYGFDGFLAV